MTHTLTPTCIAVDVPEGAYGFELVPDNTYTHWNPDKMDIINVPGDWQILCLESTMTEEQARQIVDWYGAGDGSVDEAGVGDIFMCYDDSDFACDTALESYATLKKSLNHPKGERVILIKK
jgi:hypothetical protein